MGKRRNLMPAETGEADGPCPVRRAGSTATAPHLDLLAEVVAAPDWRTLAGVTTAWTGRGLDHHEGPGSTAGAVARARRVSRRA